MAEVGPITRKLPGVAMIDNAGNIPFYRGQVIYASERIQWIETNIPDERNKLVFMVGDTYLYWCVACEITVWQQEINAHFVRRCPFCLGRILALSPGDWVRLHYRYMPDGRWANWWGEMWPEYKPVRIAAARR
jgi:DNA-directed RNA polymerase subunit RPC12/RpoP